jgi:hypothetical protein
VSLGSCNSSHGCPGNQAQDPIVCFPIRSGLLLCPPKESKLQPKFEIMSVYVRSGNRDSSKGNISWLRVERKVITSSGAGLGRSRIDSSETKGSSGQPQVQFSVSVSHEVSNPLFRHLLKHFNSHERDGGCG